MSAIGDRLRGIVGSTRSERRVEHDDESEGPGRSPAVARPGVADTSWAGDVLDGEWREANGQRFLVVDRSYAPGYRHGSMSVADGLPPDQGWPRLPLLGGSAGGGVLFLDLETTGIAGGAGTYAFLVGCGWFERARFHTRQFFLSSFASERMLLEAVADLAGNVSTVVTYNGKTFDVPLIDTRFALNRLSTPFAGMAHVDMLHHARRLWRGHDDGHRLSSLEVALFGHEREGDVPGFEIPARYFRYVHTGDARPLAAVLEHNRSDLLSLAMFTARAAQLLEEGATGAASASEALGAGRLYERSGLTRDALACFARAADMVSPVCAEALRAYALLSRRIRSYEDAARAWQRLLELEDCPPNLEREAAEALAVHHEHRLRNPLSARTLAMRSLRLDGTAARRQATEHRLARLDRKLGASPGQVSALF